MCNTHRLRGVSVLLTVLALCLLVSTPAHATSRSLGAFAAPTLLEANIYLTDQMLRPLFQSTINQQIPRMMGNAIAGMVKQLPVQDQSWASMMAGALLQPSATLLSLKPEVSGLLTTLKVSLYPGDPRATTEHMLITFQVLSASTIQVSARPSANGGPSLVNGPLLTFRVPIGSLNGIAATPQCGDANLVVNLKFPITSTHSGQASSHNVRSAQPLAFAQPAGGAPLSYIEIPPSSLARLGSSVGSIPVSSNLSAQNIRVGIAGTHLTTTADILWSGLNIGTAVSTMAPVAAGGNFVVHVLKTDLQILGGLITFPVNSYNQQIEQQLNVQLNEALTGKFTVTQAGIGFQPHLACASSSSLILGGTLALR
jgi:hypothetical protein